MKRAVAALSLLVAGTVLAGADVAMPPAARCQAAKIWIGARYVARHPSCRTTACAADWTRRLRRSFADFERRLPCITRDDATTVEHMAREFETKVAAMLRRRDRPCARLFTIATARLAGVQIRSQRPTVWPPKGREYSYAMFDRFERDRVAAKALHGCRSVILGSKLEGPPTSLQWQIIGALLPPEVATGLRVDLPPGWRLHDVAPGEVTFVTFAGEYAHGSHEMPDGGADFSVYVTDRSVNDWLGVGGEHESIEHTTIDGIEAVRVTESFEGEWERQRQRRVSILVPRQRLGLQFNWFEGDATEPQHLKDFEAILRTARLFPTR